MRPPEFTGGNELDRLARSGAALVASMRPPEFTGGNPGAAGQGGSDTVRLQ